MARCCEVGKGRSEVGECGRASSVVAQKFEILASCCASARLGVAKVRLELPASTAVVQKKPSVLQIAARCSHVRQDHYATTFTIRGRAWLAGVSWALRSNRIGQLSNDSLTMSYLICAEHTEIHLLRHQAYPIVSHHVAQTIHPLSEDRMGGPETQSPCMTALVAGSCLGRSFEGVPWMGLFFVAVPGAVPLPPFLSSSLLLS